MLRILLALVCALALAGCGSVPGTSDAPAATAESLERKALDAYTWDELSQISARIAEAATDEEGRAVAAEFGLVEDDGTLTTQTKQIVLDDTRALDVRLAGVRHDDKADGSGKAGLTFMTVGAVDIRPMNDVATVEGGWQASALRAWLATDAKARLDDDLAAALVPVNKLTNNVGLTDDVASVTATADELWVFSATEVCGNVSWDTDEFQQKRGYQDVDGLVNAEGSQYEAFAQAGVTDTSDPNGFLSLADSTGTSPWWYRTPYPFDWTGYGDTGSNGYFYQVRESGYPESVGSPEVPASVVVGFCV